MSCFSPCQGVSCLSNVGHACRNDESAWSNAKSEVLALVWVLRIDPAGAAAPPAIVALADSLANLGNQARTPSQSSVSLVAMHMHHG